MPTHTQNQDVPPQHPGPAPATSDQLVTVADLQRPLAGDRHVLVALPAGSAAIHPEAIWSSGVLLVWAAALALPAILGVAAATVAERKHPDDQPLFMAWFNTTGWLMLTAGLLAAGSWTYQAAQAGAFSH